MSSSHMWICRGAPDLINGISSPLLLTEVTFGKCLMLVETEHFRYLKIGYKQYSLKTVTYVSVSLSLPFYLDICILI